MSRFLDRLKSQLLLTLFLYVENHSLGEWFQKKLMPEKKKKA